MDDQLQLLEYKTKQKKIATRGEKLVEMVKN